VDTCDSVVVSSVAAEWFRDLTQARCAFLNSSCPFGGRLDNSF
jgi:hypothetical protein